MRYGLPETCLKALQNIFSKFASVKEVILYGSRAKGTFREFSDIDITLVGDIKPFDYYLILQQIDDLLLPYNVDLSIFNRLKNESLKSHIIRCGINIYTTD